MAGGARDSYQLPIALREADMLRTFVTDLYTPLDRLATRWARSVLPGGIVTKLKRRYSPELPSRVVQSCPRAFLKNARHDGWRECNEIIGRAAGELAANSHCDILSYAHLATSAFRAARSATKVLMQMQPHPVSVRNALQRDQLLPDLCETETMNELHWPAPVFETLCREPLLADRCIVASRYARQALVENGVDAEIINVVPYGVDLDFFTPHAPKMEAFRVLFVGQPLRQKGLHYLLEAWSRLKLPDAELRIVARNDRKNPILARYSGKFIFCEDLDWTRLRDEYRKADLLCLPSLSEGFGLVTLESLACGTPVLASNGAGSAELLEDGKDGFVIPAADLLALMAALESAYLDRPRLREMRVAARLKAEQFPWSRFRDNIRQAVTTVQTAHVVSHA